MCLCTLTHEIRIPGMEVWYLVRKGNMELELG